MCPPQLIAGLISWGKDVTTGLYMVGNEEVEVPCITVQKWNDKLGAYGTRLLAPDEFPEYLNQGLKQVQAGGFGCCLMSKAAFAPQAFYYDARDGLYGHPDIYFFNDMFSLKIPVFVDTHMVCRHDYSDWNDVLDR
jgi:hypothetical protein